MKLNFFLPKSLYSIISVHRTFKRNQDRSTMLDRLHSVQLQERHLRNLKVLPCRTSMLSCLPKGGTVCEVGVAGGDFSQEILFHTKPAKLHLIDLWSSESDRYAGSFEKVISRLSPDIDSGVVEIHRGYSWDMLKKFSDNSLDWVYLDAAHDYECIKKDIGVVWKKIRAGGLICGHDYTRWSSNGLNRWGVVEAVNELCIEKDWEFVYLTHETHRHCSFAIRAIQS